MDHVQEMAAQLDAFAAHHREIVRVLDGVCEPMRRAVEAFDKTAADMRKHVAMLTDLGASTAARAIANGVPS